MSKVKSIKFYNFIPLSGTTYMTFNVKFYDEYKNLIIIDATNYIQSTSTCFENSILIATGTIGHYGRYPYEAIHTGNINNKELNAEMGLKRLDNTYSPNDSSAWIKIEFKDPTKLSDIQIMHSCFGPNYGFDTCDYDIEYEDGIIKNHNYVSNGVYSPINWQDFYSGNFNQAVADAQFDSIEFNTSPYIYDTKIGYVETLDTNNFRNIPVNTVERLKSLCVKPTDTFLSCLVSFDQKQTWKTFDGTNWNTISDISPENIILNGMEVSGLDQLNKNKLIAGGFTGDIDFKIAMKTNNTNRTPSVTKIYIEYK